jgi:hypothetical protein
VVINEVAHLQISHVSAHSVTQDWLGFYKVYEGWVPKQLKEEHKRSHLINYQGLLIHYHNEIDNF